MSKYLLLRNNKENGPFELNDLISFGLKPYDLVWVEGKSAAWRYPSELEELKPYAPSVEEQPFDRFFKKETRVKNEENTALTIAPARTVQKEDAEEKYQQYLPKKSVVVTLPSQRKVAVLKPVAAKPVITEKQIKETPTITVTENPVAQVKYAQPLDEIKEMYVKTLEQRRTRNARKNFAVKNLKRAAIIAGLIASGLLTGLFIKSGGDKNEKLVVQQQPGQASTEQQPESNSIVNDPGTGQIAEETDQSQQANEPVQRVEEPTKQTYDISSKKEVTSPATEKKKTDTQKKIEKPVEPKPIEKDAATGERNRVVRDEGHNNVTESYEKPLVTEKAVKKVNTWGNLVSVNSNDYKRVAFGGIRNLELTVTNDSKNVIEKVVVEVQYLKSSDSPFRTEKVEFRSIAPNGGSQTLRMPDTNRGAKVSYRIIDVQTSDIATASAGF